MPENRSKNFIFITGAASGIGEAAAVLFASKGWYVGLFDVAEDRLLSLQEKIGEESCCCRKLDVTDADAVKAALEFFSGRSGGRLDVLFNSAGLLFSGPVAEIPLVDHQRTVAVNINGMLNCCYQALDMLKDTKNSRVINMSSIASLCGVPDEGVYSATKLWVRGFTEALNIEWEPHGIRVCDIMPAFVATPMVSNSRHVASMDKMGIRLTADDVAQVVWNAAHGKKLHWPVGIQARFFSFAIRLIPARLTRSMMKKINGY